MGTLVAVGLFAWQAWHLATSTFPLRGRRGTYGTGLTLAARLGTLVAAAVCMAGVALGDIYLHFALQAWHLWHWAGSGPFAWQAWHLATSTHGTGLALAARLGTLVAAAVCVAGVALGDIDLHFAWQAWHSWHWAGSGGALGHFGPAGLFAWQAWHLAASTFTLRGRHGTYGTGLTLAARLGTLVAAAVCVAGVALGDIDLHFAWQAWHLWHWAGSGGALGYFARRGCLRGRHGTWRHRLSLCVAGVALMALGWLWQRAWVLWSARGCLRGRRGTWRHRPSLCVAGMALGDIDLHFAWQAWHLWHWAGSGGALGYFGRRGCLRGRRGTWRHRPSLCVASVALGDIDLHFAWQAWHLWHWADSGGALGYFGRRGCLRGRRGTW